MMKDFKVEFCLADSEFMTAVRLAVGAVCSAANLDVDSAEDMKVCVTESCLILKGCGFECAQIILNANGGFVAQIQGLGGEAKPCDNEFSLALVSALLSSVEIEKQGEAIYKLTLAL